MRACRDVGVPAELAAVTRLAVCAIVQNVAARLVEWVAFHQIVGVERFFLYDNDSTDGTADLAIQLEHVTVRSWPGICQQVPAYTDALERHADDAEWIAFIDSDEFLWSPTGLPLPTVLAEYPEHAVGACWLLFGASGLTEAPPLRLDSLLWRASADPSVEPRVAHVKAIIRPKHARRPLSPHHFDCQTVNERHERFTGPLNPNPSFNILRINHYFSGSIPEALAKAKRRRADTGELVGPVGPLEDFETEHDDAIMRYVPLLRARIDALETRMRT